MTTKVLYLVSGIGPPAAWGTEFIQNLIFRLSQKGVRATIVNPIYKHTHPEWRKWTKEQEQKYGITIISFRLPEWISQHFLLHLYLTPIITTVKVINLLSKDKFDLIHEFSSTPVILLRALFVKALFNVPTIFTLSVYNNTLLGSFFWFKIFDFAKFYLIPSKLIIERLKKIGIQKEKIVLSPPSLNLKNFQQKLNKEEARRKLNLPQDKVIFSFFGSLTVEKGVTDLIDAIQLLDKKVLKSILINVFVVWKGSSEHSQIKKEIEQLDLPEILLQEKYINIPLLMAASEVIVLPARTGHGATIPPLSIIETIISQKFLITTDIPTSAEWVSKTNAKVVQPKNPQQLASAIEEVARNLPKLKVDQSDFQEFELYQSLNLHLSIYDKASRANAQGVPSGLSLRVEDFSPLLRREQNPSEAEKHSSHSSQNLRYGFSAKGDKVKNG